MSATTSIIEPPKIGVSGERTAEIAVAVITLSEPCTVVFCRACQLALTAGLRRHSVSILVDVPVVHSIAAVSIFDVPWSQRTAAIVALKQTLTEMDLLNNAVFASLTEDGVFMTIGDIGLGVPGAPFEKIFLPPNYQQTTVAAFKKWAADNSRITQAVIWATVQRQITEGQNPEAQ